MCSKQIKIGLGNKNADRVLLALNLLVLIAVALIFHEFFFLVLMVGGILGFNSMIIASKYYIFYSNGYFIIDHVYKKRMRIKSDRYIRISRGSLAFSLSNSLVIHFKKDLEFNFTGGFQNFRELDAMIKGLLQAEHKRIN